MTGVDLAPFADVEVAVVELPKAVADNDLVGRFMQLRKAIFIDRMAWPLHMAEGIEFEQYDTLDTTYVIAHRAREVIGGARLKRTDARLGRGKVGYSYMIRDAYLGLLPGMPSGLCHDEPPVDRHVWELTRLVVLDGAAGAAEAILWATNAFLREKGAKTCLFLGSPAFIRMARRLGWNPQALGPVVGNADGRFLAFKCDVLADEGATI